MTTLTSRWGGDPLVGHESRFLLEVAAGLTTPEPIGSRFGGGRPFENVDRRGLRPTYSEGSKAAW